MENDWSQVLTIISQICSYLGVFVVIYIGWRLAKKHVFGPEGMLNQTKTDITEEEREALARSYGEQGSKEAMKESLNNKGKISGLLLLLGFISLFKIPILGIALMAAGIYVLSHGDPREWGQGKDIDTLYKVNFLEPALNKNFPEGYEITRGKYLNDESVCAALPDKHDTPISKFLDGSDLFSFTYKDMPVSMSHNRCIVEDGKDEDGHMTYKQIFEGQVYEAKYKTRLSGYVRVIPTQTHLGHESVGAYKKLRKDSEVKVETDNIYFNEHFDVYATSQQDALFVLNPVVINYFTNFSENGGKQAMYVSGDSFVITREDVKYDVFDPPRSLEQIDALTVEGKVKQFANIAGTCYEMLQAINGKTAV